MYPTSDLKRLAAHKVALRKRIARRRATCTDAAAQLARPFAWMDRMVAFWHRLTPFTKFAAVPLGFLLQRVVAPRRGIFGTLARWSPLIFSLGRGRRRRG